MGVFVDDGQSYSRDITVGAAKVWSGSNPNSIGVTNEISCDSETSKRQSVGKFV